MSKRVDNKLLVENKKSIIKIGKDFERVSENSIKVNGSSASKDNCLPKKLTTTPSYNLGTKKYKFKDNLNMTEEQEEEDEFLTSLQMSRKRKHVYDTDKLDEKYKFKEKYNLNMTEEQEEEDKFLTSLQMPRKRKHVYDTGTTILFPIDKLDEKYKFKEKYYLNVAEEQEEEERKHVCDTEGSEKRPIRSVLKRKSSIGQASRRKSVTFRIPSPTPTSNNESKTQRVLRERKPICYTERSEELEELDSFFDKSNRVKNDQKKYSSTAVTREHFKRPSPKREKLTQSSPSIVITDDDDDFMDSPSCITRSKSEKKFRVPSPTRNKYANLPEVEFLSEEEEELPVQSSAEYKYCPFCKEPIPLPLPDRIRAYLINVNSSIRGKQSNRKRVPSPSVLLRHSPNVVDQFEFCRLHSGETHIVPKGLKEKYPLDIDFTRLPRRVEALIPELMPIIKGEVKSSYRDDVLRAYHEHGKARARKPTLLIQRFHTFQPGYYGPKGSSIIFSSIISHLMDTGLLTPELTKPQGTLEYIGQVLVPETAIRLISQDRGGISLEEASKIMKDSVDFGMYVHEDE